jgi:hypothetical protein
MAVSRLWNRKPVVNLLHMVNARTLAGDGASVLVPLLTAAVRLLQARALFDEVPQIKKELGAKWKAMEMLAKSADELLSYAALGLVRAAVHFQGGAIKGGGEGAAGKGVSRVSGVERFECANRQAVMDAEFVNVLLERGCRAGGKEAQDLQLGATSALDVLDSVALTYSQSSDVELVNLVLARIGVKVHELVALFGSVCAPLVKRSSLLVLGLLQDSEDSARAQLQDFIRAQCGLLPHVRFACQPLVVSNPSNFQVSRPNASSSSSSSSFSSSSTSVSSAASLFSEAEGTGFMVAQCVVSGLLIELMVEGNARSMDLLSRILPAPLLATLSVPWQESATATLQQRGRRVLQPRRSVKNWPLLLQRMRSDSYTAQLIWKDEARGELCDALLEEEQAFHLAASLHGRDKVTWNDEEFSVTYVCLSQEVRVGAYYLRFVISSSFDVESLGQASNRFLGQLYHAFLTAEDLEVKVGCLNAMTKVYKRWNKQPFDALTLSSLTRILGGMNCAPPVRDALLQFLEAAIENAGNARHLVLESDCVPTLMALLTRCHTGIPASSNRSPRSKVYASMPHDLQNHLRHTRRCRGTRSRPCCPHRKCGREECCMTDFVMVCSEGRLLRTLTRGCGRLYSKRIAAANAGRKAAGYHWARQQTCSTRAPCQAHAHRSKNLFQAGASAAVSQPPSRCRCHACHSSRAVQE